MKPRILLVEDDHTSAAFLAAAAEMLPASVDIVGSRSAARAQAVNVAYALWLIDAHLPDGDGAGLLAELRAAGLSTPAIAHTASREDDVHRTLQDAGFDAVLVKPLPAAALRAALAAALPGRRSPRVAEPPPERGLPAGASTPQPWDDEAALRALNGQQGHVDALRQLFLAELPDARALVLASAGRGDHDTLREALHRLRASCGFVGAARLEQAVIGLQAAPASREQLASFEAAAQELSPPS